MPKYLLQVSYTADGARGAAASTLVESLGGKIDCFSFAFGETDAVAVVDMSDGASVAVASLAVNSTGAATGRVTVLLTPEEIDQAAKKSASYTPPGR